MCLLQTQLNFFSHIERISESCCAKSAIKVDPVLHDLNSDITKEIFDSFIPSDLISNGSKSLGKCKHKSYPNCPSCQSVHNAFSLRVKSDKGLRTCHLNIRSIYGKIDEVRLIVLSSGIDIFCVSESCLDATISNSEIHIPGYDIERRDRQNGQNGGYQVPNMFRV